MIIDPRQIAGNALYELIGTQIIIGLPSAIAPFPNVAMGTITGESPNMSVSLPGFPTAQGDVNKIVAANSGNFPFNFIISGNNAHLPTWLKIVSAIYVLTATITAQFLNFGSIAPNLSSLNFDFVNAQINALKAMADGGQPILLLNSFIALQTVSQKNPFLSSIWLIESISASHEGAADSVFCDITMEEKLQRRNPYFSVGGLIENFANEILGPGVGSSIASLL